ncbi:MAG: DUF4239 domain-containing protein [Candidatus Riflebacteria bacterium]|nr:DUF4239 domain-containing protein [Candidatus Riflebacteria bacterium]
MTQSLIYYIPAPILGVLVAIGAVAVTVPGVLMRRRFALHEKDDFVAILLGTMGAVYAVLLSFVLVAVWENFEHAALTAETEASYLVVLRRNAETLGPEARQEIEMLTREYAQAVVQKEWPAMGRGEGSPEVTKVESMLFAAHMKLSPSTDTQKTVYTQSVRRLDELNELRLRRLFAARTGLHPAIWCVLLIGALVTMTCAFFLNSESPKGQICLTSLLATVIGLILFVILALDYPFTGDVIIEPEAFQVLMGTPGAAGQSALR